MDWPIHRSRDRVGEVRAQGQLAIDLDGLATANSLIWFGAADEPSPDQASCCGLSPMLFELTQWRRLELFSESGFAGARRLLGKGPGWARRAFARDLRPLACGRLAY